MAWSPGGTCIASGHSGGTVCFWTASTNDCDGLIYAHQTAAFSLAWSPDGSHLATGGGVIGIWDTQTGSLVSAFGLNDKSVYAKLAWPKSDMFISLETAMGEKQRRLSVFGMSRQAKSSWNFMAGRVTSGNSKSR